MAGNRAVSGQREKRAECRDPDVPKQLEARRAEFEINHQA